MLVRAAPAIASITAIVGCCALTSLLGCHDQDKRAAASPSSSDAAPIDAGSPSGSASAAVAHDKVTCVDGEDGCEVVEITDRAKAELESKPGHEQQLVVFPHDTTDAQLATVARIPWVTRLRLQFTNKVTDVSPLSSLVALKSLRMETVYVVTLAPLRSLGALEELVIDDVPKLTDADVGWLAGAPHLRHLELVGLDSVRDYGALSALSSLEELHLSVHAAGATIALGKLPSLKTLHLDAPEQADLGSIASAPKLEKLTLQGLTKVTDFRALATLPALRELTLLKSSIKDLAPIAAAKSLEALSLPSDCPGVTNLAPLAALTGLTALNVSGTAVKDLSPLAKLTKLVTVDVHGTAVTDLMPLAHSKDLQKVIVSPTLPEPARDALKKALPKVVITPYLTK